jgi:hypothetical protein
MGYLDLAGCTSRAANSVVVPLRVSSWLCAEPSLKHRALLPAQSDFARIAYHGDDVELGEGEKISARCDCGYEFNSESALESLVYRLVLMSNPYGREI